MPGKNKLPHTLWALIRRKPNCLAHIQFSREGTAPGHWPCTKGLLPVGSGTGRVCPRCLPHLVGLTSLAWPN